MLFKLLNLNSNLALTPRYLNSALNNSVQEGRGLKQKCPLLGGGGGGGAWIFSGTTPCSIDSDCNKMSSGFRLKLISSVGIHKDKRLIKRKFAFSDP